MEGLGGHSAEDPGDFADAIILGDLQGVDKALLLAAGVPDLGPIHEHGDYQGVVDLVPVEEVEAADQVAEDADALDGGAGMVGHDLDVWLPVEVMVDEHPQEVEGVGGSNVLGA